jgi:putative two-component system response regulator
MPVLTNAPVDLAANGLSATAATSAPKAVQGRSAGQAVSPARRRSANRPRTARIAVIDDEPVNIQVVRKYLHDVGYQNFVTTSESTQAVGLILREKPDLVILDIVMPQVDGLDILRVLRSTERTRYLPVLILTAAAEGEVKRKALELGATDFLAKPVDPSDLIHRTRNALLSKAYHDQLTRRKRYLEQEVKKRTAELSASREEVVHCLARAAEYRDDITGHHVVRVGKYVGIIARELGFDETKVELLELAAQLHDLGKVAIPDSILQKPGKLDPDEYVQMQKHCAFAKRILQPIHEDESKLLQANARLGGSVFRVRKSPLLILAARIAQTHHERWDGTGYPLGLAGEDIPIEGRMTAVADVYDALCSRRPYKSAFAHEKCLAILEEGRGTHFDPRVLDALLARMQQIIEVQNQYNDAETPQEN